MIKNRVINKIYLNIVYGLLLGESFILNNNKEIKLIIKIEGKHTSYMTDIHKKIFQLGYCQENLSCDTIQTKLAKKGKLKKLMLLHTYNNNYYLELYNK
jgi:ribosomal protein S24E